MKPMQKAVLVAMLVVLLSDTALATAPSGNMLRIAVPQNLYAHLWKEIALDSAGHIELEATMKADSKSGWTWAPGIHLVWISERAYARIVQQQNGTFNVLTTVDKPVYPINTWIGLKLELTESEIRHWVRQEGGDWELIIATPLDSKQKTPPTAIAIGKGASAYGTLMRSHTTPGDLSETYFSEVILRVDGEVLIHETFDQGLEAWEVFVDPRAPEDPISVVKANS